MSDLIDRQAAIDMLQRLAYDDWNQGVSTSWADAFEECAEIIRDLPSAQPEIVRCKDCKHNKLPSSCANVGCEIFYGMTDRNGFCHMAERRTDENKSY